jgi:hypothetical protein
VCANWLCVCRGVFAGTAGGMLLVGVGVCAHSMCVCDCSLAAARVCLVCCPTVCVCSPTPVCAHANTTNGPRLCV